MESEYKGDGKIQFRKLKLQEFCDMEKLYKLLDNWSKSSGMACVLVDQDGNMVSETFGMTDLCKIIQSCEKCQEKCLQLWRSRDPLKPEVCNCHAGFCNFSIPLVLPDGMHIGTVLAGQVLYPGQNEDEILKKVVETGVALKNGKEAVAKIHHKTKKEMESSFELLKIILSSFIQNRFLLWKKNNELKLAPAKKDKVLSQITQLLYSYNLTVDLETGFYTLITGTGMERTVAEYKKHNYIFELETFQESIIHPAYSESFHELLNFDSAGKNLQEDGFYGSLEYPVLYFGDEEYEWHEINVFIDTEENGKRVANILGRDVTEIHIAQERREKELRAAAAKNQILSELTKMLYSYNLTLNLRTGKYSLIIGTGMTKFMEIFNSTDDYETAYNKKISYLDPKNVAQFSALASLNSLRTRVNSNGFIGSLEYGAITDNGEEWHEINVFISTDERGEPIANILGRDITDAHKRQEKKENQQKAAMARDQLLSGVTKMLYSYNLTVNLNTWKYSLITGTGMNDVLDTITHTDDYILLLAKLGKKVSLADKEKFDSLTGIQVLKNKKNLTGYTGSVTCKFNTGKKEEWHEINLFMGTNEDGISVANILGRDITDAHKQQEAKELELKAAAAKDQILSDITKTLYGYNLTLNLKTGRYSLIIGTGMKQFIKIFEATDEYELAYRQKLACVTDDFKNAFENFSSISALRKRKNETGCIGNLEYSVNAENGIEWHEINIFLGSDENGNPIANILGRDITEAHDRADTKAQLRIATAANEAKSAFLFNMSHDIRTPMNAIIGFTELLGKHLDDKELAKVYIKKIQTSNEFLLSLINNVLEMARIESGKTTIDETYWTAQDFNDTLFFLFESQMKAKGIEFVRSINVVHNEVLCDEIKLREIFLNILSNALKYTPSGGKVSMDLSELPSENPDIALYQTVIQDSGIGMSQEFLPHIFEEFTRERSSTESRVNGTGLGMAIVKKLVNLLGGFLQVESQIGKGTKFTVVLPHRITSKKSISCSDGKSSEINIESFKGKRILLAEDNELNAEIAISILEEAGFEIEHASDGIICVDMLEKAHQTYYDLILMDIQMPNMDGYKATQTIRKFQNRKKAEIPIIAMTANAFEEDRRNAIKAGMNGHISKPINVETLMQTLSEFFEEKKKA